MNKNKANNNNINDYAEMFSGILGQEYDMLKLICPLVTEMSRLVGVAVQEYGEKQPFPLSAVELGGGTGITTLSMLLADDALSIVSIDISATMQDQAKQSLNDWVNLGRLSFSSNDALTALKSMASNSVDIVASAYTLHNFEDSYRFDVIQEIFRVLKPCGKFINGDRYALDNISDHTQLIQKEVSGYFKVLTEINRLDLLEHWIVHLFSDESENHVMRESSAIEQLNASGFIDISLTHRIEANALLTANKP